MASTGVHTRLLNNEWQLWRVAVYMVESSKRKVGSGDIVPCGFSGGGVVCSFVCFVF